MSRRSRPPLYEFISKSQRDQGAVAPPPSRPVGDEGTPPPVPPANVGQSVRLPVGYIFLAVAAMLLFAILAYALGSWRGREAAEEEFFQDYPGEALIATDPLKSEGGSNAGSTPPAAVERTEEAAPPPPSGRPRPRSVAEDPREPGLFYFALAETRPEGARRLATFCLDRGLDAYVVTSDTPRLRRVICLPGLTSTSSSSSEYRKLKNEILRVGRLWKAQHPGERDLSDAYLISKK